jgi:L-amino acid N-acyltransferase YncA
MAIIRFANPQDAAQILEIYAPFCNESAVSFELRSPSLTELQQRIQQITQRYPWLVCEQEGTILGYAYASSHRSRAAYQWSVDVAIYSREQYHRCGMGRSLYTSLFQILKLQGFFKAYAGIALPNPSSIGLHQAMGFECVGVYRGVGYKAGAWRDVAWWQLCLQPEVLHPPAPIDIVTIQQSGAWQAAIAQAESLLRLPPRS